MCIRRRGRTALGVSNFAGDVGKVGVAGLIGVMIAAGYSWQTPVLTLGWVTLICAAVVWICLRVWVPDRDRTGRTCTGGRHAIQRLGRTIARIRRTVFDRGHRWSDARVPHVRRVPDTRQEACPKAGLSCPCRWLPPAAWREACGILAERYGTVRTIVATEVASAAGILWSVCAAGGVRFLRAAAGRDSAQRRHPHCTGTVGELVEPERVSRAFGLFYTLGSTSGVVAPVAYGLLADQIGVAATMLAAAAIVMLTIPLCLWLSSSLGRTRQYV
jgi:hypothetical protein